jgi:hypothetical protein
MVILWSKSSREVLGKVDTFDMYQVHAISYGEDSRGRDCVLPLPMDDE